MKLFKYGETVKASFLLHIFFHSPSSSSNYIQVTLINYNDNNNADDCILIASMWHTSKPQITQPDLNHRYVQNVIP